MKKHGHPIIKKAPINLSVRTNKKSQTILLRWWENGHFKAKSFGNVICVENWINAITRFRNLRYDLENICLTDALQKFTGENVVISHD